MKRAGVGIVLLALGALGGAVGFRWWGHGGWEQPVRPAEPTPMTLILETTRQAERIQQLKNDLRLARAELERFRASANGTITFVSDAGLIGASSVDIATGEEVAAEEKAAPPEMDAAWLRASIHWGRLRALGDALRTVRNREIAPDERRNFFLEVDKLRKEASLDLLKIYELHELNPMQPEISGADDLVVDLLQRVSGDAGQFQPLTEEERRSIVASARAFREASAHADTAAGWSWARRMAVKRRAFFGQLRELSDALPREIDLAVLIDFQDYLNGFGMAIYACDGRDSAVTALTRAFRLPSDGGSDVQNEAAATAIRSYLEALEAIPARMKRDYAADIIRWVFPDAERLQLNVRDLAMPLAWGQEQAREGMLCRLDVEAAVLEATADWIDAMRPLLLPEQWEPMRDQSYLVYVQYPLETSQR